MNSRATPPMMPSLAGATRRALAVLLGLVMSAMATQEGQAFPSVSDTYLLRAITAQVIVRSHGRGAPARCLGIVVTVRDPRAYVATAKRCLAPFVATPLATGVPFNRLGVDITVRYADGTAGTVDNLAWMGDVVSLVASFSSRPASYNKLCRSCSMYADFGATQTIPVSLPATAAGQRIAPRGVLVSDAEGNYGLEVAGLGLAGSAVVDSRNGDLVGIITVPPGTGAHGWDQARLSTGQTVNDLTRYAVVTFEQ